MLSISSGMNQPETFLVSQAKGQNDGTVPRVLHIVPALFGPSGAIGGAERYAA